MLKFFGGNKILVFGFLSCLFFIPLKAMQLPHDCNKPELKFSENYSLFLGKSPVGPTILLPEMLYRGVRIIFEAIIENVLSQGKFNRVKNYFMHKENVFKLLGEQNVQLSFSMSYGDAVDVVKKFFEMNVNVENVMSKNFDQCDTEKYEQATQVLRPVVLAYIFAQLRTITTWDDWFASRNEFKKKSLRKFKQRLEMKVLREQCNKLLL